ncbi:MAG: D-xylose transport system substrate-binding protein [Chloroflexota bacterium]|nr:D-xylose transport system substrate-binding protein [Chloroflexota bacterium]
MGSMRTRASKPLKNAMAVAFAGVFLVAACSGSAPSPTSSPSASAPPASSSPAASASGPTASAPALGVGSFDSGFSVMSELTALTAAGSGLVGVILPDTTSSSRYVDFDAPYLTKAFTGAGYKTSDFKIDNAQGNDATELALAQADITLGAKVLVVDPLDSTVGNQIQAAAAAAGVREISYDRATFQGTDTNYVSFDNEAVGKLIGQGFMDCVTAWKVAAPKVFELDGGEDTDPNAISFAQGYNSVIWGQATTPLTAGLTNGAGFALVGDQIAPGWNNTTGGTIFQQQFTAHPEINSVVTANDGLANAVVTALKSAGVPAKTIPTTGQDATLQGMQNTLEGYQCGSVYKPVYLEAQAAVALATYLRAGVTPPAELVNGTTTNPADSAVTEPATLLTATWVDTSNMASTVIKDAFVSASDLCAAVGAAVCTATGIAP